MFDIMHMEFGKPTNLQYKSVFSPYITSFMPLFVQFLVRTII